MYQSALYKAIRYFGSQKALAKAIGIKQQAISNWLNREHSIPYKQVLKIVAATQGYVTYHELAPEEKSLNKIVDDLTLSRVSKIVRIPIESIQKSKQLCLHAEDLSQPCFYEIKKAILKEPVLVDEDYQLLSCDCQLKLCQQLGQRYILAKIIHVQLAG